MGRYLKSELVKRNKIIQTQKRLHDFYQHIVLMN
jgi:hypothetical protein